MVDPPATQEADVDADEGIRTFLCQATRIEETRVPKTIEAASWPVLPRTARLSFCRRCWDGDVRDGRQPYVRQRWSNWFEVICPVHKVFLAARPPGCFRESANHGWAAWWQTESHWATSLDLAFRQPQGRGGTYYEPGSSSMLSNEVLAQFLIEIERIQLAVTENRISANARRTRNAVSSAKKAWKSALSRVPTRVNELLFGSFAERAWWPLELDIKYLPREAHGPLLLENRISVLVTAAELLRVKERGPPIDPQLADAVRSSSNLPRPRSVVSGVR